MATYDIDNLIRELPVVGNLSIAKVTDTGMYPITIDQVGSNSIAIVEVVRPPLPLPVVPVPVVAEPETP